MPEKIEKPDYEEYQIKRSAGFVPSEAGIYTKLQDFGPRALKVLEDAGYFKLDRSKMTQEQIVRSIGLDSWNELAEIARAKNLEIWDMAYDLFAVPGLEEGVATTAADLKLIGSAVPETLARQWYEERGFQFVTKMTNTDITKLKGYVWSHRAQNERDFAKWFFKQSAVCGGPLVKDSEGKALQPWRVRLIKRTEIHTAETGGSFLFAKDAGAVGGFWRNAHDDRVRDAHKIDGEWRPIGEPYSCGEIYPSRPNCRCHIEYTFSNPYGSRGTASKVSYGSNQFTVLGSKKAEAAKAAYAAS
jgi:hypothetical protein